MPQPPVKQQPPRTRTPPPIAPPPLSKAPAAPDAEVGVYYRDEDYAGVMRRLWVDVLDVTVVVVLSVALVAAVYAIFDRGDAEVRDERPLLFSYVGCAALWFVYFVILKRSALRTLGYRIGGVRIVNLRGNRPGIFALTLRLLFAFFGPFNFLVDLIWIGNDRNRQALRDKFARTYVIRRDAQPAGTGPVQYEYYGILGTNFIFAEVAKPTSAAVP